MAKPLDEHFMRRCLSLAQRGAGKVSPNPMVGCVIVRQGKKIAEGWHKRFGDPHAEREALQKAGLKAKGSTLYVNLEPCSHWGKTPPCTDAIVNAGVRRIVAAIKDPNPLVSGKGFAHLKKHGVDITAGVLVEEARTLNKSFIKWTSTGLPYVTLKTAMTLDGKICTRSGESRWVSSPKARAWVHRTRARMDAVIVGARTVLRDNPRLTSHGRGRNPLRVVVDGHFRVPLSARVFNQEAPTLMATTQRASQEKIRRLGRLGIKTILCPAHQDGRLNAKELLKILGKMFVSNVLVEGGGDLNASFIEKELVDEVIFFVAPKIFGGREARTPVEGRGVSLPRQAWNLRWDSVARVGDDLMIKATPTPHPTLSPRWGERNRR